MNRKYVVPVVASNEATQERIRSYITHMNIFSGEIGDYHPHRMYEERTRLGDFIVVETTEEGLAQAVHDHLVKGGLTVLPVKDLESVTPGPADDNSN